jgi:Flp pilus assembly protein TadD
MRKLFIILLGCTILLLAGYAGLRSYKEWKANHMLALARQFLAKSNGRNAYLSLREALASNPQDVEATRLTADVLEAARSPDALVWRGRVVELNPKSVDDRLALVETAMLYHEYSVATHALEGVPEEGKTSARYHSMAGMVAVATGQLEVAKAEFQEASRLDPQDTSPLMNLSVLQIHGTNEAGVDKARIVLQDLSVNSTNASLRCKALRELVTDALRYKHEDSALALSGELLLQTNSNFQDKVLRLETLREIHNPDFNATMAAFETEAGTNSTDIYDLATWQQTHQLAKESLSWLQRLPAAARTNQPVMALSAESCTILKDWPGLQRLLQHQNWGGSEFIRHAFLARAFRGQDLIDSSKNEWEQALTEANAQKMSRMMLLRFSMQWGWQNEAEDLLWTVVNQYPNEKWAGRVLGGILYANGQTRSMLALYSQEVKAAPSDLDIKNNLAATALLLNAKEVNADVLAHDVYTKVPTNSAYASTYAFSLLMQKKPAQALTVIEQLKPAELEDPSVCGYYGIILAANGDRAKARKYLDLANKSRHLPEELKLFAAAGAGA